jgi:hypothetical protein
MVAVVVGKNHAVEGGALFENIVLSLDLLFEIESN